jgi:murein DD-endopeptidase MepM/ murein hydrolase activator NlpD
MNGDLLASLASGCLLRFGSVLMTGILAAPSTLFRDRELFVHDGTKLRRMHVSWRTQALFAMLVGILLAFSTYSVVRFLTPHSHTLTTNVPAEMIRLAAATEQRVNEIEQRQQLLAAMIAGDEIDPAVLRRIASSSAQGTGGPLEPVGGDATFKQLFNSWKKLDSISAGAIAVPSDKPVKSAAFTSGYGVRSDPFRGAAAMHAGIDLAGPVGTPIYATADGIVTEAAYNSGGYGNLIKLNHGRGIETRYAHLSSMSVSPGERVTRGQVIGRMGSTGRSTGSHLHYEVRIDGRAVNPIPFMKSTDYLLAMQKNNGAPMDGGHVALGGPQPSPK